jgi:sugar lactone lactonase YvrE
MAVLARLGRRVPFFAALAFACGLLVAVGGASASTPHDLRGTWSCCGSGGAGSQTWTITEMDKSSGSFSGKGEGGCCTFPVKGTATGDSVTLTTGPYEPLTSYSATFKGTISADSKTITGEWDDDASPDPSGTFTATRPEAPPPGDADSPDAPSGPAGNAVKPVPGDIYVSDSSANVGSGAVYKVNPENGTTTLVHQGAPFANIRDIALGPDGNLYVTDIGASAIHRIDLKTHTVTRLTPQFDPLLRNPWGIVYDPALGDFLVTDFYFGSLLRVDPKSGAVKSLLSDEALKRSHSLALVPGEGAFTTNLRALGVLRLAQVGSVWKTSVFKKGFPAPFGIAIATTPAGSRFFITDSSPPTQVGGVYSWLGSSKPELIVDDNQIGTPAGLGLSSDGKTLYIGSTGSSAGTGSLIAMNLADRKLKTVAAGFVSPVSIAVAPPKKVTVQVGSGKSSSSATPSGVTTTITSPNQPVFAAVAVSVNLPGGGFARASKAVRVKGATLAIPPGKRTKIWVPFKGQLPKKIKAALRAGKKVKAKVTVKATAANGATRKATKRVTVKG